MHRRIADAERGHAWSVNDRKIAELKDVHRGEIGWLIGNGPSVRAEDLDRLVGAISFGCNRLYLAYDQMRFRPTYLCSTDKQMIRDFGAEMIACHPGKVLFVAERPLDLAGDAVWFRWQSRTPLEFSDNVYDSVMPGGGTLVTAIQIGFHMGIKRFYLYGVDHDFKFRVKANASNHYEKAVGDENHFIENYRSGKPWAPPVLWQVEGALLSCLVFLQMHSGWIKNATRGGKLDVLDRVDFDEIVPHRTHDRE